MIERDAPDDDDEEELWIAYYETGAYYETEFDDFKERRLRQQESKE